MVNVERIQEAMYDHFEIHGDYEVDSQTGIVNVQGSVEMKGETHNHMLPVKFGHVTRNFDCSYMDLISLKGAPDHVGGNFRCGRNRLTSLQHAPQHVSGVFNCTSNLLTSFVHITPNLTNKIYAEQNPFTDLTHVPIHAEMVVITYSPHTPLLRLISCEGGIKINHYGDLSGNVKLEQVTQIEAILRKHAHTGKAGALKAAAELIRAGFKENARW